MYDAEDMESQPLAGYTDGSEDGLTTSEKDKFAAHEKVSFADRKCHLLLIIFIILVTNAFSGAVGAWWKSRLTNLDSECALHTTQYSPVLKDVAIKYEGHSFNGSFMEENIYRKEASPEVDVAWEALGVDARPGIISEEQGRLSGLTSAHVRRAEKYGGGFFVNVEGLHHLHCLNLLRKAMYYNYDYYKELGTHAFLNEEHIVRLHVSHCLDTIRQVLMCNADTGVLGQVWYNKGSPKAFPDFNTKHTCKNYDDIRAWGESHQAPSLDELPDDYMRAPDNDLVYPKIP